MFICNINRVSTIADRNRLKVKYNITDIRNVIMAVADKVRSIVTIKLSRKCDIGN